MPLSAVAPAMRYKTVGVYKIACSATRKIYIGSSADLYHRACRHVGELRSGSHSVPQMQSDFAVFGEATFSFTLIEESASVGDALKTEMALLELLKDSGCLYNRAIPRPVAILPVRPNAQQKRDLAKEFSFKPIFDKWPSTRDLASDMGVGADYAGILRRRDSLPAMYWMRLMAAAARRGIEGVSLEALATIEAGKEGFLLEIAA